MCLPFCLVALGNTLDGKVVRLRTARRENIFLGLSVDQRGSLLAGFFNSILDFAPNECMLCALP